VQHLPGRSLTDATLPPPPPPAKLASDAAAAERITDDHRGGQFDTFKEAARLAKVTSRSFYLAQPQIRGH
jgi:hypothetical protein